MRDWTVPPAREHTKSKEELRKEREKKVKWLIKHGYLRSERIKNALLKVPREDFMRICVRKTFRNVPRCDMYARNLISWHVTISAPYCNLRSLGSKGGID
jgi:hypothetical protein